MDTITTEGAILLENLRTAFVSESNGHVRYVKFAAIADGEGWRGVGCLFRATAAAEQIHASNHGRILHQLGGPTDLFPQRVDPGITLENLRRSLAGELFEVETMYPPFIEQARQCRDVAVVRTLTWAWEAEKTHVRLFNEALARLEFDCEESWIKLEREFYVCPVCGYTSVHEMEADMCHVCNCAQRRFGVIR
jgi:rubrerythrin